MTTAPKGHSADELKRNAAAEALTEVESGMRLGLGTGSTTEHFVRLLAARVREGLAVSAVATSERTAVLARAEGIDLIDESSFDDLDLAVDGTDEVDKSLRLIKGGGGALLREKLVAASAKRFLVIADSSKLVDTLGAFPLPIEIVPFGVPGIRRRIERAVERLGLSGSFAVREKAGAPYYTDGGHLILDAALVRIPDPEALAAVLSSLPGVVDHGLFVGLASAVILAGDGGVVRLLPPESSGSARNFPRR